MKLRTYAIKPTGDGCLGALARVSMISPWAEFATAAGVQVRHTGNAGRPKGLSEGSTV